MPIFGYAKREVGDHGLLEMSEVTFDVSPDDLRRVARFLLDFADQVESGAWRSGHRHLAEFDPDWKRDHPRSDVIVIHPSPDPPAKVL